MKQNFRVIPLSLKEANEFIAQHHRHHKPPQGMKFAVGAEGPSESGFALLGVAICSRPVCRNVPHRDVIEVSRLCTFGTENVCSFLYGACARIAKEMGYKKIQTYLLETELGTSVKAANFKFEGMTQGGQWSGKDKKPRRTDQPTCPKQRWSRVLI